MEVVDGTDKVPPLVVHSCYTGAAFQHSHGISLFFPWADMTDANGLSDLEVYRQLAFANETHWPRFLETYFKRTQRGVRSGNKDIPPKDAEEDSRLNRRQEVVVLPQPGKYDSAVDSKYDSAVDSKYDSAVDSKYDSAVDSKFAQALRGTKIASMKNPPVRWTPCY